MKAGLESVLLSTVDDVEAQRGGQSQAGLDLLQVTGETASQEELSQVDLTAPPLPNPWLSSEQDSPGSTSRLW